jgi:heterodisulfide reductase subunit B
MKDKYLFYPGCSMESSAKAYSESLMAINEPLGLHLEEIHDWNCCGATEYLGVSLTPAYALIARNLALAYQQADGTHTVVAPCSACYLNLAKADFYMNERPSLGANVNTALAAGGLHYDPGSLDIRHLLDVIVNDIGLDAVKAKVVRPLKGLRVAPYLGCMVPRPDYQHRWSNPEYPNELDRLLKALGAEVIDFPLKTHCCGGSLTGTMTDVGLELNAILLEEAECRGAEAIITICPLCQFNLDVRQREINAITGAAFDLPILLLPQILGWVFGGEARALGLHRAISGRKVLDGWLSAGRERRAYVQG